MDDRTIVNPTYLTAKSTLYALAGRLDTLSGPAFMEIIENNANGVNTVRVDAQKLEYISSAGRRVLETAADKTGQVIVEHLPEALKAVFPARCAEHNIRLA